MTLEEPATTGALSAQPVVSGASRAWKALITRATTLEAAYDRHHAGAVRLAYLLCGDPEAAEDHVADVWVKVHKRLERGPIDDIGAYVRRAVVNQVNSGFRRLALVRRDLLRRRGDDRGDRPHDQQIADQDAVVRAPSKLPDRTRAAVVLRYYNDLSVAETAAALGVSEGTVKSSVSRGLASLQAFLTDTMTDSTAEDAR